MTLQLNMVVNGPYVKCDTCQMKLNLPGNVVYGKKFLKPSLKRLGMVVKGPHICRGCREIEDAKEAAREAANRAAYHGDIDGDIEGYDGA